MKKRKLNFFENISIKIQSYVEWLTNKNADNKNSDHSEVSNEFDKYMIVEDVLFCIEMIDAGYTPDDNQNKLLSDNLLKMVLTEEISYEQLSNYAYTIEKNRNLHFPFLFDYARKNNVLDKKWEILADKETIEEIVENFMNFMIKFRLYYRGGLNHDYKFENYKVKEVEQRYKLFNVYETLFKQLYDAKVMDGESFNAFSKHVELTINEIKLYTNKHNLYNNSFQNIKLDKLESSRIEMRNYVVKNADPNNKIEIIKKIKKMSDNSLEDSIKKITLHKNYTIKDLEEHNQKQIKSIELLSEKIGQKEVNEWIESRLPVILEKYLSIDNEYRTKLKNSEGYNAEQLMQQSLDNIINILEAKLEDKNAQLMTNLSIENRKLKMPI